MQTMQAFYNWLFVETESKDKNRKDLVRLTRIDPAQLAEMESEPGWEPWEAREIE